MPKAAFYQLNHLIHVTMSRPFITAVECGRVTQAKQLHKQGASLNSRDRQGHPALLLALRIPDARSRSSMVSWLLHAGADTGYIDPYTGRNLLTIASYFNCTAEIHLLLELGSQDVVAQDNMGRTALHYATVHNNVTAVYDLAQYSRRYCIPVSILDNQGWTPFSIATVLGYNHIRAVLVQTGDDSCEQFLSVSLNIQNLLQDYKEFHWFMQGRMLRQRHKVKPTSAPISQHMSRDTSTLFLSTSLISDRTSSCIPAHKPKSTLMYKHEQRQTSTPLLSDSATSDGATSCASVTSMDYIRKLLSVQSVEKTLSYRSQAVQPKRSSHFPSDVDYQDTSDGNADRRGSLSFPGVAKLVSRTLSMKKRKP